MKKTPTLAEGFHQSAEIPSVRFLTVAIPTELATDLRVEMEMGGADYWDAGLLKKILEKGLSRVRAERRWAEKHPPKKSPKKGR